jgi:lipid-binding SYLF domain-containing protein
MHEFLCLVGIRALKSTKTRERRRTMKKKTLFVVTVSAIVMLSLALFSCATAPPSTSEKQQQQDEIRSMANASLSQLYAKYPEAKSEISNAAGYAVFSDFGMKILFMGGAGGSGIAVDNTTRQETFMKMVELQPGLGVGAQKYRVVFVFEDPEAFKTFVTSGWEAGANAMAAAKAESEGGGERGGVSLSEGVKMYQLNEDGAIVGVSITGAKYYKDDELN